MAEDPRLEVDDLELRRPGASYTVDTLRALRRREPSAEIFFLVGVDQVRELHTWRDPEEVARLACLAVLSRGGEQIPPAGRYRTLPVTVPRIDIAATEIRARVAAGRSIRYLVPERVREYIESEGLYRRSGHRSG